MITNWTKAGALLMSLVIGALLWYGVISILRFVAQAIGMLVTGR